MEITCPHCRTTNQIANERCTSCNEVLRPEQFRECCPTCRVRTGRGIAYCPNCGQPLGKPGTTVAPLSRIASLGQLRGGRQCSKCGTLRSVKVDTCPDCGTRRSRIADPVISSFWDIPQARRREITSAMRKAVQTGLTLDQTAAVMFNVEEQPYFREFPQYFDLLSEMFK